MGLKVVSILFHFLLRASSSSSSLACLSPLQLYQMLLQARKETKTDVQVEMISFSATRGFGHNNIYLDPNLSDAVG